MLPATMDPEPLADIMSDPIFDFFSQERCVGDNALFRYLRVKEEVRRHLDLVGIVLFAIGEG